MTPEQVSSDPTRDLDNAGLEAAANSFIQKFHALPAGSDTYLTRIKDAIEPAIRAYLAARSVPEAELKEALENVERYVAVAREEKERAQASEAEASDLRRKLGELHRAILGGEPQSDMRHGQFIEMVKTTEAARAGALARAETAERKLEEANRLLKPFDQVVEHLSRNHLSGHMEDDDTILVKVRHVRAISDFLARGTLAAPPSAQTDGGGDGR
ncbi:hypothetical protein EOA64_00185 [Mesorhizobium sp. M1A.F.Ca.IN.022.02.1.1]|uniref:hypothetical protein n=1 Tax=Mesorhizobium sp. M1A.F.Ca.IN.022.02.1.1 TaxID=2496766 RepID=UPI000FCBC2BD|nr:hypothetical protein [Mesorhizobium sp. M1A.F.Ca.IN.022.02.1.1]RUV65799.1 hypothetical protein EOA64_00185 [Mesorhizobium sp. M1A.F.Ca.IN.022.02.1.1]